MDSRHAPWRGREPRRNDLAASLTRAASLQTFYTVRFLVDRDLVPDAYRAYAYFRWVDDCLDSAALDDAGRTAFVAAQQDLLDRCLRADWPAEATAEEQLLIDLIGRHPEADSGLHRYLANMMAVMAFDAGRRGRLVGQAELSAYTHHLALAVTEALHFFIGRHRPSPQCSARYWAATGAHIAHMLRDTVEDAALDYYNVPAEYLERHEIGPRDLDSPAYRDWVRHRVKLARAYLKAGRIYLAQVSCGRCRLAGYAYIARFEAVLEAIQRDGYRLRPHYLESPRLRRRLRAGWRLLVATVRGPARHRAGRVAWSR